MQIRLDENHLYWVDDRSVPGFTQICTDLGVVRDNPFYTELGREAGTALHLWCNFLARGEEPADPPDERIAGRVFAFRKFLKESGFKYIGGEEPQHERRLGYCCSPDLWGVIGARRAVVDIKGGGILKFHALQTAAQRLALASNGVLCQNRYGLYLRENGTYRLLAHEDESDELRWSAMVAAYYAKRFYAQS